MKKNTASQLRTLRRVLAYTSHARLQIVLSLLFAAISVVLTLYLPVLTGNAIDLILGPGQVDFDALLVVLARMAIVILLTAAAQWIMAVCNNRITYSAVQDIRGAAFAHLQRLPLKYIDSHPAGDIVSRIIADVDTFADGLLLGFSQLFTGALTILCTLVFMLRISVGVTIFVVLATPLSLFAAAFIAKKSYNMFRLQSATRGEQTALINEMIGGQKVVQAFGREKAAVAAFDEINDRLEKFSLRATFFSSLTNPCTRFVNSMVYAGVAIIGALSAIGGGAAMTVGQLTCFLTYANQYTKPFNEISGVVTELQNAIACAARIFELIDEEPELPEGEDALQLVRADGRVSINDVSFSYNPEKPLIEDFNLDVEPGRRIAIVGPTGCGKTTLINLLMRFYDTDGGSIEVSGRDIRQITRRSLRRSYGMVLQDTWLKTGTIRENIALSRPDASEEEVIAAAKAAHAHSFIRRMPLGYNTPISEDGAGLSEGQKQLLCIARAMLNLPPMLILDEATSSIDTRTEMKIQDAFASMMRGRTSFIVAHRLSTIENADSILVMQDGKIVEKGTHRKLLRRNGFYAQLYNSQFAH
ncbi:MAG: ABC transporter ATP-binding protein [Clostridia bacterium]|nr:ABC transporter ATP-binding protein [Clostridia bacterium]